MSKSSDMTSHEILEEEVKTTDEETTSVSTENNEEVVTLESENKEVETTTEVSPLETKEDKSHKTYPLYKPGDRVEIIEGARWQNGTLVPHWTLSKKFYVTRSVSKTIYEISVSRDQIKPTGVIHSKYLTSASPYLK